MLGVRAGEGQMAAPRDGVGDMATATGAGDMVVFRQLPFSLGRQEKHFEPFLTHL